MTLRRLQAERQRGASGTGSERRLRRSASYDLSSLRRYASQPPAADSLGCARIRRASPIPDSRFPNSLPLCSIHSFFEASRSEAGDLFGMRMPRWQIWDELHMHTVWTAGQIGGKLPQAQHGAAGVHILRAPIESFRGVLSPRLRRLVVAAFVLAARASGAQRSTAGDTGVTITFLAK